MTQLLAVPDVCAQPSFIAVFRRAHEVFKPLVAAAEKHELYIVALHDIVEYAGDEVKALLLGHARDHCDKRHVRALLKPHFFLQCRLADGLALQVPAVICRGEELVGMGIEHLLVDTVYDARKLVTAGVQDALKPLGVIRHFYLRGVAGADGVYAVGKNASGLEKVRTAVELHEFRRIVAAVDVQQILHVVEAELALKCDVMYRQQKFQSRLHTALILRLCQHRQHRGVPVVAVQHLRREVEIRDAVEHSAAEKCVLLALGLTAAVYFIAEVLLVVDEVYRHAVKHQLLDADICLPPAECAVKVEHVLHAVGVFILDDAVIRRYDARVDAELCKRLRQRADDVGKPAGLAQRRALCRRQQHIRQRGEVLFTQYFTKLFFHGVLPFVIF